MSDEERKWKMSEVIEGLKIDVPAAELKKMLEGRLEYHQAKAKAYEEQQAQLQKVEDQLGEEAKKLSKVSHATVAETLESSIKKHKDQIIYYKFMAEHVIPNKTYRLQEHDLTRLGVQSNHHY